MYVRDLLVGFINSRIVPRRLRPSAWRALGHDIGADVGINANCFLGGRTGLTIGDHSFVGYECFFDLSAPISIGRGCDISSRVTFMTSSHDMGSASRRAGSKWAKPVDIGDGVWIGAAATVLPGVKIGRGAVIAAGAVVVGDCVDNSLYAGVPARLIRAL